MPETTAPPSAQENRTSEREEYSFEEFRMMYESTECVSDRKISFMRNNSQLCLAIIAGQGVAAHWSFETEMDWTIALTVMVIGALGVFFCFYWITQLNHLRALNAAKFEVLNEMAAYVVFPQYDDKARNIRSKNPFQREWKLMEKAEELVQGKSGPVPKAKDAEALVPWGFLAFFAMGAAMSLVWLVAEASQLNQHA